MGFFDPSEQKSTTTSEEKMKQDAQFDNLLSSADDWLASGGMGEATSYMGDMNAMMSQMGQGYMDMMSGKGQADRYQALQDTNAASAAQAANALGGELASIGLGASGTGTANGSRRGIAEGVAIGAANRDLASQQAQQNQQYLQNEQALKQQGLQGLSGLFNQAGQMHEMAKGETAGAKQMQNINAYQSMISGNMGGTTTTTQITPGKSMFDNVLGAATAVGGMMMSDKKLKKKIKKIRTKDGKKVKTKDDLDLYVWEWNKKAEKEYGLKGVGTGVLAQEVEKKKPSAVKEDAKGNKAVNYGALM